MEKVVVLLSGKQGSGKSTLALGIGGLQMKFADPLYKMHWAIRDILEEYGQDDLQGIDGPLLQLLGTEWGRKTRSENIWVDCLVTRVEESSASLIVIDDCRFPNELRAFDGATDIKVIKIRLHAGRDIRKERAEKWRDNELHLSETALDNLDAEFDLHVDTGNIEKSATKEKVLAFIDSAVKKRAVRKRPVRRRR